MILKIGIGQIEIIPGRPDLNARTILALIQNAREKNIQLLIFPELSISGYLLGDLWEQQAFLRDCESWGQKIIEASENICVVFGNIAIDWKKTGDDGRVRKYNACFVAQNGKLVNDNSFLYPFRVKTLLPNYREFDDTRHFYSLRKLALDLQTSVEDLLTPITISINGSSIKLGCLLCEDGWNQDYGINPAQILKDKDTDLLINISCSPFTFGKNNKRHRVFSLQAHQNRLPLIYVNNVGIQNNGKTIYTFDGASSIYSAQGNLMVNCKQFVETLEIVDLSLETSAITTSNLNSEKEDDISCIYHALRYGISKFLSSINMHKVVIGLSGGIDSAVSAALYTKILGPENVLLVNMPGRHNSETTKRLAAELANNLGCPYTILPIQESVDYTVNQLESADIIFGSQTTHFEVSPFIKENIQARDRSARILAGLAATFGGGFTCNANKSEITIGYSTFYGDLAGFLAALADLWKYQIYDLGHYLNEFVYCRQVIPEHIFSIKPSAELSSEQNVELNQGDPLIYPYHDYLFRAFIEHWNRATPEDLLAWYSEDIVEDKIGCEHGLVKRLFPTAQDFISDLERWWKLYSGMAVAKRIQAPPILAISRRAYGFDHREAQLTPYFTAKYYELKKRLLDS